MISEPFAREQFLSIANSAHKSHCANSAILVAKTNP